MKFQGSLPIDANFKPFTGILPFQVTKEITFDGGTANAIGDYDGTGNPVTVATVTGDCLVFVAAVCKTTLVGAGTIELGVTNATAALLPQITNATTLVEKEFWFDATPTLSEANTPQVHGMSDQTIILTAGTANITAGKITFYIQYLPLSADAKIV